MLEVVLYALGMLEGMRRALHCMLEAVEGELCLLEVLEVMRCVLLCILEAVEGGLYLLEVVDVTEVVDVAEVVEALVGDAPCASLYVGGRGG